MSTKEKKYFHIIAIGVLVLLLLYLLWKHSQEPAAQTVYDGDGAPALAPDQNPYNYPVPGFVPPAVNLGPGNINVNVSGSSAGYLSGYFPLFGFVGIDTTQLYQ